VSGWSIAWCGLRHGTSGRYCPPCMKSVHILVGDEFLCDARARELLAPLAGGGDGSLCIEKIDGRAEKADAAAASLSACLAAVRTVGFFGQGKGTWLQSASFLGASSRASSQEVKSLCEALAAEIKAGLLPGHVLVITAPAIDKRQSFFKSVEKLADVEILGIAERQGGVGKATHDVVAGVLSDAGVRPGPGVVQLLSERTGSDMRTVVSEVEKLALYAGGGGRISVEDVELLVPVSRELPAWDLADAFGRRDLRRSLLLLRQLMFQGAEPMLLLSALRGRVRDLAVLREALDRNWAHLSSGGRGAVLWREWPESASAAFDDGLVKDPRSIHPYRALLLCEQAKSFTEHELIVARRILVNCCRLLLSSSRCQPGWILEMALLRILAPSRAK